METIYRVQDKHGRGPWKPGFSHKWVEDRPDLDNLLPFGVEFGPVHQELLTGEYGGCGCKSTEQLKRWFTRLEYQKLLKYGYKAVKMKVNRIIAESATQCVFGRAKPLRKNVSTFQLYRLNQ